MRDENLTLLVVNGCQGVAERIERQRANFVEISPEGLDRVIDAARVAGPFAGAHSVAAFDIDLPAQIGRIVIRAWMTPQAYAALKLALDDVPPDLAALVVAAREFIDIMGGAEPLGEYQALDAALERFAALVPYENEPAVAPPRPAANSIRTYFTPAPAEVWTVKAYDAGPRARVYGKTEGGHFVAATAPGAPHGQGIDFGWNANDPRPWFDHIEGGVRHRTYDRAEGGLFVAPWTSTKGLSYGVWTDAAGKVHEGAIPQDVVDEHNARQPPANVGDRAGIFAEVYRRPIPESFRQPGGPLYGIGDTAKPYPIGADIGPGAPRR